MPPTSTASCARAPTSSRPPPTPPPGASGCCRASSSAPSPARSSANGSSGVCFPRSSRALLRLLAVEKAEEEHRDRHERRRLTQRPHDQAGDLLVDERRDAPQPLARVVVVVHRAAAGEEEQRDQAHRQPHGDQVEDQHHLARPRKLRPWPHHRPPEQTPPRPK